MTLSPETVAVSRDITSLPNSTAVCGGVESTRHGQTTSAVLGIVLDFSQVSVFACSIQQLWEANNASLWSISGSYFKALPIKT